MRDYFLQNTQLFRQQMTDQMPLFLIVFLVGLIIQLIKVMIDSVGEKHVSLSAFFSS